MQCHYCEDEAAVAVEKDHLTVGLCERHFRERIQELRDDGFLDDLQEELDIDRS